MLYLEDELKKIGEKADIANGLALLWSISSTDEQERAKLIAFEAFLDSLEEDIEDVRKEIRSQRIRMGIDEEKGPSE